MKFQIVILIILFSFFTLSAGVSIVYAEGEVPLYVKYRYEKMTGRKWYDASPERQQEFIDAMRKQKEEEKQKKLIHEANLDYKQQVKDIAKAQRKNKEALREQDRIIAANKKKIDREKRKTDIALKKQQMAMKMEKLRTNQDRQR